MKMAKMGASPKGDEKVQKRQQKLESRASGFVWVESPL
jgi:hypothetical protein